MNCRTIAKAFLTLFLFAFAPSCASRRFNAPGAPTSRSVSTDPSTGSPAASSLRTSPEPGCDPTKIYGADVPVCDWGQFPEGAALAAFTEEKSDYVNYGMDQTYEVTKSAYGLAGGAVLAAMKDMFDRHATFIKYRYSSEGGRRSYFYDLDDQSIDGIATYINKIETCVNTKFNPFHWSDIQIHYYCVSLNARGCYTYLTANGVMSRSAALAACESYTPALAGTQFEATSVEPETAGQKSTVTWNETLTRGALDFARFFRGVELEQAERDASTQAKLTGDFEYRGKTYKHTDVFRYAMLGKTFAFPDSQQNRVINEFWAFAQNRALDSGELKGNTLKFWPRSPADFSSANPTSCEFRQQRYLSEMAGEHCKDATRRAEKFQLKPRGR